MTRISSMSASVTKPGMLLVDLRQLEDARWQARDYLLKETGLKGRSRGSSVEFEVPASEVANARAQLKRRLKWFLRSKNLNSRFKVVSSENLVRLRPVEPVANRKGKRQEGSRHHRHPKGLLRCPHCGRMSPYPEELRVHVYGHYFGI